MWGEYVFARLEDKPAKRWPITKESGLYRLFPGNPSSCTKIVGTSIGDKFVLLFQKLNSPHKHQLIVQYLNPKTLEPLETLHTPYLADKAEVRDGFFLIRTHPLSRQEADMGKVTIGGNEYRYQDHRYPVWVSMGKNGFTTESEETFRTFSYKKLFKNIDDFKRAAGWDASGKSFSHLMIYVAINHKLKSKCILLVKNRTALTGNENWICQ